MLRSGHTQLGMWLCVECSCVLMLSGVMGVAGLCAEGIWCDGSSCGCVLRASGVMRVAVVV